MVYVLVALSVVALSEAAGVWYLWSRWRSAQVGADASALAANASAAAMTTAFQDLALARGALAKQNDLEAKADAKTVATHPELAAAIDRANGL